MRVRPSTPGQLNFRLAIKTTDTFYKSFLGPGPVEIDLEIMGVGAVRAELIVAWYDTLVASLSNCRVPSMFWKTSLWGKLTGC